MKKFAARFSELKDWEGTRVIEVDSNGRTKDNIGK